MQSINVVVINPLFLGALFSTGVLCVVLLFTGGGRIAPYARYAALASLIGTLGVTMFGNVPLNNRLAAIDPQAESSVAIWQDYVHRWIRWGHLRLLRPALLLLRRITMGARRGRIGSPGSCYCA
jgi:uncharacterized membrane protein